MMERSGVPMDASAVLRGWRQDASDVSRVLSGKAGIGGRGFLTEQLSTVNTSAASEVWPP
jgi:hypothetical protein